MLTGGEKVKKIKDIFYRPTISRKYYLKWEIVQQEEVFGPIAPIIVTNDEKEAIKIANDSKFGLGASIWDTKFEKAEKLSAMYMESGIVTVNNMVVSDPRVPIRRCQEKWIW